MILRQSNRAQTVLVLERAIRPKRVVYVQGEPCAVSYSDGSTYPSVCIGCLRPRCMFFTSDELANSAFPDFPGDPVPFVCPTGALRRRSEGAVPEIEAKLCIGCGLCVSRCPIGAMYLTTNGASVQSDGASPFVEVDASEEFRCRQNQDIAEFRSADHKGAILQETDDLIESVYRRVRCNEYGPQFPNLLTRNLLIALGVSCSIRRRGDVNLRMDAVMGPPGVRHGVAEVEFGVDVLESPRNMLDDLAVLSSRYGLEVTTITPVIVSLSLPNARAEYWRVIGDIKKVLGIRLHSMSIGALLVLLWSRKSINLESIGAYSDSDTCSIRPQIEGMLGRQVNLFDGILGVLEPQK